MNIGTKFLIKCLGLLFLITSMVRTYLYEDRQKELDGLRLPKNFDIFIIIFEFMMGMSLIFDLYDTKKMLIILLLFILIGTVLIIVNNYNKLINEINEIFFYLPNMEAIVLHLTYSIIIISIILNL